MQQYDRQLSLQVSNPVNPLAASQSVTQSGSGTTTTFGEAGDGSTVIEFGGLTPGSTAVKGGTTPTAGLDIRFNVQRGDTQTPNSCDVRIYNLNDDTANSIGTREFRTLTLKAGYPGNVGLIFSGEIIQVRIGRENALDTYVDITAADGDSAYNFSRMAITLAAGAKPADAIQQFIARMATAGIIEGYTPTVLGSGSVRNRVFYGMTKNEMRQFCKAHDLNWSIQDGKLTFIPLTGYIPGDAVIISPQTGLLDTPEQTQHGVECTVLLNPNIRIGQLVRITNSAINQLRYGANLGSQGPNQLLKLTAKLNGEGLYYVMSANHYGQTRGPSWETKLTLLAVDATAVTDQQVNKAAPVTAAAIARN